MPFIIISPAISTHPANFINQFLVKLLTTILKTPKMTTMNDTGAGGTCTNPTDVAANTDDFNSTNFPNVCM